MSAQPNPADRTTFAQVLMAMPDVGNDADFERLRDLPSCFEWFADGEQG